MKPIIELIYDEPEFKIDAENMIYEAVQNIGINFDKDRLVKALIDSRSFYEEGYADAKKKYDKKWIPCSEKPPEEKRPTESSLLQFEDGSMAVGFYDSNWECWRIRVFGEDCVILHEEGKKPIAWQPLPPKFEG